MGKACVWWWIGLKRGLRTGMDGGDVSKSLHRRLAAAARSQSIEPSSFPTYTHTYLGQGGGAADRGVERGLREHGWCWWLGGLVVVFCFGAGGRVGVSQSIWVICIVPGESS